MAIVFINNIDSYASKCLAQFLSESEVPDGDRESESEDEAESVGSDLCKARSFQVVGTIEAPAEEERPYVQEEYYNLTREQLLQKLLACDFIIYNVTQHAAQLEEASWAVSALHSLMDSFSGPKVFILVSTVMTWARSKPDEPEMPLIDEDFRRRRAHPNFQQHLDLEKRVVKMGKTRRARFSSYVVASGLQYGMGEQLLHFFFKTSWLGVEPFLPVFGEGTNVVPMIHVGDLARIIRTVMEQQPKLYYLLAVDESHSTMEEIVKAVSSALGPGKTQQTPFEEAFLSQDLSVMEIDSLSVDLHMEAAHVRELFTIRWLCEGGLVENIGRVVEEFRRGRGLMPIRLCVLGPPAVGKSSVSQQISLYYGLHHITLKEAITQTIAELEDTIRHEEPDEDSGAKELLDSLRENTHKGRLEESLLVRVIRDRLMSNPCRNQGFILDGFPKTYEQARALFSGEGEEGAESEDEGANRTYNKNILPECVVCLDASDPFLKDRVMNLPERLVEDRKYHQDHFLERLSKYRENNVEDKTIRNYFEEVDLKLLHTEVTSSENADCLMLIKKILRILGGPRNYGPSMKEVDEEERRRTEERMVKETQERAEEEREQAQEARQRARHWADWMKRFEEVRQEEQEQLEVQSLPLRSYLTEHVMPTLSQGLMECCSVKPQDPVDFLAEFLLKNNPRNS